MFNFFKNNIKEESLALPFTTDIHSHILPGIDDGAADLETSLLLIKGLYSMGIRKAIATPHIIG
ncbi:MAG: histidinol phosphatase, partial [Chitinophagaceae bacterium]|nr:histidinol phosphatase [Chitinophagaceae bacterium]